MSKVVAARPFVNPSCRPDYPSTAAGPGQFR